MKKYSIGVDIGGTKCAVLLGKGSIPAQADDGFILEKKSFFTQPEKGLQYTLDRLYAAVDALLLERKVDADQVTGIGISCGGPLDHEQGIVLNPPNLYGWNSVPIVELLQERYGFAYGMTGTLLSLMSVGNLLAGLLMGMLPSALGMKRSVLLLTIGYAVGYAVMGLTGAVVLLAAAFFVVGIAKGSVINTCTILVSDHSADRTRGMNLMHSCYACGALLCPFLIAAAARVSTELAVFLLAAVGLVLWLVYVFTPLRGGKGKSNAEKEAIDWSFLRSARFWLLTGLLFFQNAAEQSVNGWMVTYFKGSGIIAGTLAAYTVTVMWGATLVGRLLIAFVFPLKNPRKAMVGMSVLCTVFYVLLVMAHTQGAAIALLFAFAISMSGLNPTAVASAGRMTSVTSMGIMLPVASSGAILMPWVIGMVAERAGLAAGMASNIVPCVGLVVFTLLVARLPEE